MPTKIIVTISRTSNFVDYVILFNGEGVNSLNAFWGVENSTLNLRVSNAGSCFVFMAFLENVKIAIEKGASVCWICDLFDKLKCKIVIKSSIIIHGKFKNI